MGCSRDIIRERNDTKFIGEFFSCKDGGRYTSQRKTAFICETSWQILNRYSVHAVFALCFMLIKNGCLSMAAEIASRSPLERVIDLNLKQWCSLAALAKCYFYDAFILARCWKVALMVDLTYVLKNKNHKEHQAWETDLFVMESFPSNALLHQYLLFPHLQNPTLTSTYTDPTQIFSSLGYSAFTLTQALTPKNKHTYSSYI